MIRYGPVDAGPGRCRDDRRSTAAATTASARRSPCRLGRTDRRRPTHRIPTLAAPIVLVHGLCGFDRLYAFRRPVKDYFPGIREHLEAAGNRVLVARVSPTAGVAAPGRRAEGGSSDREVAGRAGPPDRPQHGRAGRPVHDLAGSGWTTGCCR